MRTSGAGSDGPFIMLAAGVLLLAGMWAAGGPYSFFHIANRTIVEAAERLTVWAQWQWSHW